MAEGKLKPAAENPWYVLATIHGEQDRDKIDWERAERNRRAWNAWSCQNLSEEDCAELAGAMGLDVAELRAWPEIEKNITEKFRKRLRANVPLPEVEHAADLSDLSISNAVILKNSIFTQAVHFDRSNFAKHAIFDGTIFTQRSGFLATIFSQRPHFSNVKFLQYAHFRAVFDYGAEFGGATFEGFADFYGAKFGADASFVRTAFKDRAIFVDMQCEQQVSFNLAVFAGGATFENTHFKAGASFSVAQFVQATSFNCTKFSSSATFDRSTFRERVDFRGCIFAEKAGGNRPVAVFRDCEFQRPVTFREAEFADAYPDWSGAILPPNITLTGKNWGKNDSGRLVQYWPKDGSVEPNGARDSCAIMRHALNQQGLPEAEHYFFRKEMYFAGRTDEPFLTRFPYLMFGWVSDFGYSIRRPAWLLFVLWLLGFAAFWGYLSSCCVPLPTTVPENPMFTAMGVSFGNVMPFFGAGGLFDDAGPVAAFPDALVFLAFSQKVLGILFLFFLGLGLRTRFRLR